MSERTWKIALNEDELKALIEHHSIKHSVSSSFDVQRSARIHDLTKRLNRKDEIETEKETDQDQPAITNEQTKSHIPSGW